MATYTGIVQSIAMQAWEQTFAGPPHRFENKWQKKNHEEKLVEFAFRRASDKAPSSRRIVSNGKR